MAATVRNHIIIKRKRVYGHYLLLVDSCWALVKIIYRTLMISGSHVTVGAPRECGMFGGKEGLVKCLGLIAGVSFVRLTTFSRS